MTVQQIIDTFRTNTDQQDDLTDSEVLALAQKALDKIYAVRDWIFLTKEAAGTLDTINTEYSLPTDFANLVDNYDQNANPMTSYRMVGDARKVLYVGADYQPYPFITMAERRKHRNSNGYVYIDFRQDNFVLTKAEQTSRSYEFDYKYRPADVTVSDTPALPGNHTIVAYLMAVLWNDIDMTPKSASYRSENEYKYEQDLADLEYEDAKRKTL